MIVYDTLPGLLEAVQIPHSYQVFFMKMHQRLDGIGIVFSFHRVAVVTQTTPMKSSREALRTTRQAAPEARKDEQRWRPFLEARDNLVDRLIVRRRRAMLMARMLCSTEHQDGPRATETEPQLRNWKGTPGRAQGCRSERHLHYDRQKGSNGLEK